jgi:hypothetical protein
LLELAPPASSGAAWSESVIYQFANENDASFPQAGVVDSQGNMYGTTFGGGVGWGTVFQVTPPTGSSKSWSESVLYSFTDGSDGAFPKGGLIADQNGALYGTTSGTNSGSQACIRCGTVFQLSPPSVSGGAWTLNTLYTFLGGADGGNPSGNLVFDSNGALYGTTLSGGTGNGTVFQLAPPAISGGAWSKATLYAFQGGSDGMQPNAMAFQNGMLFGTTYGNASGSSNGTVFELTPPALSGGAWTETVLWSFAAGNDGSQPYSNLLFDGNGALYGATERGGSGCATPAYGCGIVYQLVPPGVPGGNWTEHILYRFAGQADGYAPNGLAFDGSSLVGSTSYGGSSSCQADVGTQGCGTLFQLSPGTGSWSKTLLHTFAGTDGAIPLGTAVYNGASFGVTADGGRSRNGTVFELTF